MKHTRNCLTASAIIIAVVSVATYWAGFDLSEMLLTVVLINAPICVALWHARGSDNAAEQLKRSKRDVFQMAARYAIEHAGFIDEVGCYSPGINSIVIDSVAAVVVIRAEKGSRGTAAYSYRVLGPSPQSTGCVASLFRLDGTPAKASYKAVIDHARSQ